MAKVYLALYKGRREGRGIKVWWHRLQDWFVRTVTRSQYSHCEIAVSQPKSAFVYTCYSSSARDGGVRRKDMVLTPQNWDLIPLKYAHKNKAEWFYGYTKLKPYDWLGVFGLVLPLPQSKRRWFCSEWCAVVVGFDHPYLSTPQSLADYVKTQYRTV